MNKTNHSLALKIKELRKANGLTQKQLAAAINVSYSAIVGYENGRREPNSKAMAALESYFHVTGEYLRGESEDSGSSYIWQDQEVMDAVKESFPSLINKLLSSVLHGSEADQKVLFNILVELCHMASLKNVGPEFRTASFLLLEEAFTSTTRFIDFYSRTSMSSEVEARRFEKYRQSCVQDYDRSLNAFLNSLDK